MKELKDTHKAPTEQTIKQEQQKEYSLIESITMIKGLFFWEYDVETDEIKKVNIEKPKTFQFNAKAQVVNKAILNRNAVYVQALNKKNALRKVLVIMTEAIKNKK